MKGNQLNLFPTQDFGDHSFEYKRAAKAHKREDQIGKTDLIIVLPRRYMGSEFAVSRTTGEVWFCQDCHPDVHCRHIKALKELLRAKPVGYTDVEWLRKTLPVGEVK